jgi:hypothetical protein
LEKPQAWRPLSAPVASNGGASRAGKTNLGAALSAPFTVLAALREIPPSRLVVVGQSEPQEIVPVPKSPVFNTALKDFLTHQLAILFLRLTVNARSRPPHAE